LFSRPGVARRAARGSPLNPTERSPFPAWAPLVECFDQLPLPLVIVLGIVPGGGPGALGVLYGEASAWLIIAPVLFIATGWLGDTAAPLLDEKAPHTPPALGHRQRAGDDRTAGRRIHAGLIGGRRHGSQQRKAAAHGDLDAVPDGGHPGHRRDEMAVTCTLPQSLR